MSTPISNPAVFPSDSVLQGDVKYNYIRGITTTRWSARTGGESQTVYKGKEADIKVLCGYAQEDGFEYTLTTGHIWTLTITFPVDIVNNAINNEPQPLTTWELSYNPLRVNILEANDRRFIGKLKESTKKQIDVALKLPYSKNVVLLGPDDKNPAPYLSANIAYRLKSIGVEGRNYMVPTLKRSAIFSNTYDPTSAAGQPWDQTSNNKLMTTFSLKKRYGTTGNKFRNIPEFIQSQLPSTMALSCWNNAAQPSVVVPNVSGYSQDQNGIVTFVGWLEFPAEYQTISLNKVQATQQWQFNKWSAGQYGLYDPFIVEDSAPEQDPRLPTGLTDGF